MNYRIIIVFLTLVYLFATNFVLAEEVGAEHGKPEEAGHEKKKKPDEKPKPDSAVSSIMQLKIVKKWQKYVEDKNNGNYIDAWGEMVKTVNGSKCWNVAVGEFDVNGDTHIWKRFCVQQTGLEMWVESPPADPLDDMKYLTYEEWLTNCKPTYNSPGKC